jgi:type I restriction enzyme S subunit
VEYLDLLENINKINKDKIENLKKANEIYLNSILLFDKDIEIKILDDICDMTNKGNINTSDISNSGEYPFYSASVSNPTGSHNKYSFDDDEYILFIKSGGNSKNPQSLSHGIGKVYHVNGKSCGNTEVVKLITVYKNILLKYLYYYLKNEQLNIQKLAKYSTNLGHIDMNEFMNLKIPIPSLEKQNKIVKYLDLNNDNIRILEKEIEFNKKQSEEFIKNTLT